MLKKAKSGDASAQNEIAVIFKNGDKSKNISQNYKEAKYWFQKAVDQNLPLAQYNLGHMYYHGEGVLKNPSKALKLIKMSAMAGNPCAQYTLGCMFESGEIVPSIYKILPIEQAADAHAILERGENIGKVVLTVCE